MQFTTTCRDASCRGAVKGRDRCGTCLVAYAEPELAKPEPDAALLVQLIGVYPRAEFGHAGSSGVRPGNHLHRARLASSRDANIRQRKDEADRMITCLGGRPKPVTLRYTSALSVQTVTVDPSHQPDCCTVGCKRGRLFLRLQSIADTKLIRDHTADRPGRLELLSQIADDDAQILDAGILVAPPGGCQNSVVGHDAAKMAR